MSLKKDSDEEFTTKVFTNDDYSLKLLGELLGNQVSRNIIRLLIEKEMYANEIANNLGIQFNLISHHLKKMGDLGLLSVNKKRIVKKGTLHKHYKMVPGIFVLPNHTKDKMEEKGFLKKIFKDSIKFTVIGIATLVSWVVQISYLSEDKWSGAYTDSDTTLTVPLIIVIIGLSIIYFRKKRKGVRNT
ncbi:ArsR/SmtB family transcription factor [Nitrosopumilus ureiphilus]|uniref:HTH arsR-type domain-containing protein n=1 Tax=Nitrosopumilus ureiphilus TaxID=1470067 RepID=A0A7D5M8G2_9ARCH|nr:winged helix-turn-helix domain-containing protein [Nitrosopumilus ureiphilus]QLH07090.1 hypothetical protein C5F50_08415 [Nitrosopumilus ureiphilus]